MNRENAKPSYTFEEIKQKMMHYCAYQDRSHQEVEQKMRDFFLIPEAREELLLFLMTENYLNEERFTRSYIRGKFYIKQWGRVKIKNQLKFKGVPDKLINQCLDEIDLEDYLSVIQDLYHRYYNKQRTPNLWQRRMKTVKYLMSRGFEYEIVMESTT